MIRIGSRQWGMLLCASLVLVSLSTRAATRPPDPDIQVRFDRQSFVAGEPFQIEISVTAEGQGEPNITLPNFEGAGFQVLRKNVTRPSSGYSFSFSIGTGQNARQVIKNSGTTQYSIVLSASRAGKYSIEPVKVVLDGFTFTGKRYPIEVFDRGSTSGAATASSGVSASAGGAAAVSEEQLEGAQLDPDYFLHMIPSKRSCTVGEQIVLDVYLFTSVGNIRANQFDKEPGTEGFWVERFDDFDLRNYRNRQVVINGILYEQVLLKKLALFPTKSGSLTISPPILSFMVGGGGFFTFSRGKQVRRAASAVTIDVLPLPATGKPSGFADANIGQYSFFVDTGETNVKTGELVTVTVSVRGSGNIRSVVLPEFGEVDGFKMYPPETDVEVEARGGQVTGMSQSKTLFIPEKEGNLTVPALSFSFFDLRTKSYKTVQSKPIAIRVAKGKQPDAGGVVVSTPSTAGDHQVDASIERMNAGMRTIVNEVNISKRTAPMFSRGWYLVLIFGVPVLFFGYLIVLRVKKRAEENFTRGRSRRAEADAKKALASLEKESGLSNDRFFSKLHKIVLSFLEDRLEETVVGDTMNQLSVRLSKRGVDEALCKEVVATLEEYEFARFARTEGSAGERSKDVQRAAALISKISAVALTPAGGAQ
ncbi:MAG: protein BatD [Deltaproteobacteria bacterium]|nr:protein BatD [Deltaproteobacteria bacterium]